MKWIKCSERLPITDADGLVCFDGKKVRRNMHFDGVYKNFDYDAGLGHYQTDKSITHWMIVEPPEDENDLE